MNRPLVLLLLVALQLAACGNGPDPVAQSIEAPEGFRVQVFARDLLRPTQMAWTPNGDLLVAQLAGSENDATGQIVLLSGQKWSQRTVLQEGLTKPTGIALAGDRLWVMEERRLSVTSLDAGAPRETVLDEMPFNGRSQGTLTMTPEGTLLYDTSGAKRGPDRIAGSGMLFAIKDAGTAEPGEPTAIASGFKHAYAHTLDADGQLWSVEMTDGNFDGERASDELLAIDAGDDAGWPQCVEDNRPVSEYGGTETLCELSPRSHALFGIGATPTSLIVAPWDNDILLAALWLRGQVVTVPRLPPGDAPHEPTVFLDGIESPIHLLSSGQSVLVADHETGTIFIVGPN